MTPRPIFFDLDGTLTDSGEGIINCAILALNYFGLPIPTRETMRVFVGPPLQDTFVQFGVPKDRAEEAITIYRSRYTTVGKFENFPYPGVREMLETLKERGHRLFVATSKPEDMAVEILQKFQLDIYFDRICGATYDGSRDAKADVIAYLLNRMAPSEPPIMVGDTAFDVTGASVHHIPTVGVAWGYGQVQDMLDAGAVAIINKPEELPRLLEKCKLPPM